MCTVTYIPTANGTLITSNRDEHFERQKALIPIIENVGNHQIIYPKDPKSNGTWIAAKNNGQMAVLLNGAFQNHVKQANYRESRGIIFLTIFNAMLPLEKFKSIDLNEIENFTLILYSKNSLTECRWDGLKKHILNKNLHDAHIWSSATLYTNNISKDREEWFNTWLKTEQNINQQKVINFHFFAGKGDKLNNLVMQRDNGIATVSITSIIISTKNTTFIYRDIKDNIEVLNTLTNGGI